MVQELRGKYEMMLIAICMGADAGCVVSEAVVILVLLICKVLQKPAIDNP